MIEWTWNAMLELTVILVLRLAIVNVLPTTPSKHSSNEFLGDVLFESILESDMLPAGKLCVVIEVRRVALWHV